MKYKLLIFILLLQLSSGFAQNIAKQGIITLADNQKIAFNDLTLANGRFSFTDVAKKEMRELAINEVQYVEDAQMSRVFTNKKVEAAYNQKKEQLAAETKLKIEEFAKPKVTNDAQALNLYENGIYKTKEDFIARRITATTDLIPKSLTGLEKQVLTEIADNCFFYYYGSDEKVKNVFAVSYKGHLYFQIYAILENRNKTDRAQSNNFPNSFVRVLTGGGNYYYTQVDLVNQWAQGLAYSGGAVGTAIATSMYNLKGVVWDIKNKEFNIFKNCSDYNDFIKDKLPESVQECSGQQFSLYQVRNAIEKIK